TALQFTRAFSQFTPDVDVNVVRALLVFTALAAETFVDRHTEARDSAAVGGVTHLGVAREVAYDHHLVQCVAQAVLALGVDDSCFAAARADGHGFDAVGVDIKRRALLAFLVLPRPV